MVIQWRWPTSPSCLASGASDAQELTADQLRRRFDPSRFAFKSTADAPDLEGIIGQERAARAIEFGLEIPYPGYNVFATGPTGAGKTSIITRFLQDKAAARPVPPDWGYVHNFAEPDRPIALRLPPGGGLKLRDQVNALLSQVAEVLEKLFVSDQYVQSRNALGPPARPTARRPVPSARCDCARAGLRAVPQRRSVHADAGEGRPAADDRAVRGAARGRARRASVRRARPCRSRLERTIRQVQELEEAARERLANMDRQVGGVRAAAAVRPPGRGVRATGPSVTAYLGGDARPHAANTATSAARARARRRRPRQAMARRRPGCAAGPPRPSIATG